MPVQKKSGILLDAPRMLYISVLPKEKKDFTTIKRI